MCVWRGPQLPVAVLAAAAAGLATGLATGLVRGHALAGRVPQLTCVTARAGLALSLAGLGPVRLGLATVSLGLAQVDSSADQSAWLCRSAHARGPGAPAGRELAGRVPEGRALEGRALAGWELQGGCTTHRRGRPATSSGCHVGVAIVHFVLFVNLLLQMRSSWQFK